MDLLWSRIYDLIIKTILSGEHHVMNAMKKMNVGRSNCFQLLGFDVLVDSDLKPWVLEVNLSPSLVTDSPLDHSIKATLLSDSMNIVGVKRINRRIDQMQKIRSRFGNSGASSTSKIPKSNSHALKRISIDLNSQLRGSHMNQSPTKEAKDELIDYTISEQAQKLFDQYVKESCHTLS